jgi:hypothetical protein
MLPFDRKIERQRFRLDVPWIVMDRMLYESVAHPK